MSIYIIPWEEVVARINLMYNIKSAKDWEDSDRILALQEDIRLKVTEAISNNVGLARAFFDKANEYEEFYNLSVDSRKAYITRKENGFDQTHFVTIETRTLYNVVTGATKRPHNRIKICFSIYLTGKIVSYEEIAEPNPQNEKGYQKVNDENPAVENKLKGFFDKYWKVYYYHYSEVQRKGFLGMAMLFIDKIGKVEFKNIDSETSVNYEGTMYLETTFQHLIFDLHSSDLLGKHVNITVFIGSGKVYPLLVGLYKNIYSTNSIVAGTIILEISNKDIWDEFRPLVLDFEKCEESGMDNDIVTYLRERSYNFIKAPSKILSKDQLRQWLKDRKPRIS